MSAFKEVALNHAYRLLGHGPVVWVSTRSPEGRDNLAPIAWQTPIAMEPTQVLLAIGLESATYSNLAGSKEFIVSVPLVGQARLVRDTGSVSGATLDKFSHFNIPFLEGRKVRARIPLGVLGYLECRLDKLIELDEVGLVFGECLFAAADAEGFQQDRVQTARPAGKTLHHLGGNVFAVPSDQEIQP